jgi:CheY-like chemotaxis protein
VKTGPAGSGTAESGSAGAGAADTGTGLADPSARRISIVLVDDVPAVRQMVRTALRLRGGFEVVGEASDGAGAVELAASLRPDVVVLDLGLPDLAGREVLTRVREHSPLSKIVVFTGTPGLSDGVTERADGFVTKDAELTHLVEVLEALGGRRGRDAELFLVDEPASVALARRFARSVIAGWKVSGNTDELLLVVSELVTNAFEHAHSPCRLRLELTETGVRVAVHDGGLGTPDVLRESRDSEHGRGLYLVTTFASAWGTEQADEGGKVVWAELPRFPTPPVSLALRAGADTANRLALR